MHTLHGDSKKRDGPETTGATIQKASQYDIHTSLMGLGVNHHNSRMIIEMAMLKQGDKVLDVGCGSGSLTLTAKSHVGESGHVYGIDAAPEMIEVARKKAKHRGLDASFEVGLIEKLPFSEAKFDVVISRLVMHHLPEDLKPKACTEIYRVLKPDGRFFITDFKPPTHPVLARVVSALVGQEMMMISNVESIVPVLKTIGFIDLAVGSTRSAFLAFVSGRKPGK